MEKSQIISKLDELQNFKNELVQYSNSVISYLEDELTEEEKKRGNEIYNTISKKVGYLGSFISELSGIANVDVNGKEYDMWLIALKMPADKLADSALGVCLLATNRAIGKLEDDIKKGVRDEQGNLIKTQQKLSSKPPKAFIAHEGETKALDKLKAFLDALGVTYLIAEIEPSNGRLVEGQVDWSQGQADFAIILATKGKVVNKKTGKPQIGTNVADELGRTRQVFKNRIILLRQTGVEVHTNVSGIVRERFSPQSMDKAFIKIANELRNWRFLITGKVEE